MLGVEGWGVEEVSATDSYWEETREAAQHPGCTGRPSANTALAGSKRQSAKAEKP